MKQTVYVQVPIVIKASNEKMMRYLLKKVRSLVAKEYHPISLLRAKSGLEGGYVHVKYERARVVKP